MTSTAYPTPGEGYDHFLFQNDRNGWGNANLDRIRRFSTASRKLVGGMVKNLPLLRGAGNNGRPWVHAVMCDNTDSDICMIIHASTL